MSEGDEAVGPVPALQHKLSVGQQPEQHHLRGISTSVHSSPPDSPMHLQGVRSLQDLCILQTAPFAQEDFLQAVLATHCLHGA